MVVYYSATGNSRYCARMIADLLGDSVTDAFPLIRERRAADLHSDTPWVFVAPTYGWKLPRIFADFLRRGSFSGSQEAYFVLTCGSDIGSAADGIQTLCRDKGFRYKGVLEVVMPENYIVLFRAPEAAQAREIIAAAQPCIQAGAACIRRREDFPPRRAGMVDKIKSGPVNALFYRFTIKAKPFHVTDSCIGCGKCAEACVLHNIRMEQGRPVWGADCTHCMACICGCPAHAIEYGRATRGKVRYQFPSDMQ